jgi:Tfp pilus assembly protein PilV
MSCASSRGFSLLEALIASLVVGTAVVGLAHLVALAADQSAATRRRTTALSFAQAKLEELRSLEWTYAADAAPISSPQLALSPPGALFTDYDGYADTRSGFVRRWAISRLTPGDADTLILQVCVFAEGRQRVAALTAAEACVATIRVRRP